MTQTYLLQTDDDNLRDGEDRFRLLVESVRDYAIFMLDPDGYVLTWNAGAERFKGYRAHEIIGLHFSVFYPAEALSRGLPAHELEVAAAVGSYEDEGWRVRKDGSQFWANVVISAMRNAKGDLIGFSKVTRDLTLRRGHEEALRQSEERFRLLVEGVAEYAIFMLDVNGKVATWNSGAQRMKGYAIDEILGRHFSIFYPAEARESGWPDHELQSASEQGSFVDVGWRIRKDGSQLWASVTITALRDASGTLVGFAKLTRDLTETKRAEANELASHAQEEMLDAERSARMAAQRTTRIKDEFLATLSHELRTPLSAILGWTQVLLRSGADDSPQAHRRALEVIDRNARAQVQLIDDLLDLSRIMTGKIRLNLQQVVLLDVVSAAIDTAIPGAQAKDIQLISVLDPASATVSADPHRLQQVIWNLLSNAIKFTPKGGQVRVALQRVNSQVELTVSDNGIGIPASFLPQVFDRFSQRDSSTTRAFGGLGLGLAISKQLVELHGGTINVMSEGEGKGAAFSVKLPLSVVQLADEEVHRHREIRQASDHELAALPQLEGVHVFVIDDEPDARDLLRRVFEDQRAHVTSFDSAEHALEALRHTRPTLVVSDVGMPHMDGYQFMRELRSREARTERIPAVALTAFARAEDRKLALLAGYQAHVAKPFDVAELLLLAADLVGR
jgi:PAS domain S-box-containing protein